MCLQTNLKYYSMFNGVCHTDFACLKAKKKNNSVSYFFELIIWHGYQRNRNEAEAGDKLQLLSFSPNGRLKIYLFIIIFTIIFTVIAATNQPEATRNSLQAEHETYDEWGAPLAGYCVQLSFAAFCSERRVESFSEEYGHSSKAQDWYFQCGRWKRQARHSGGMPSEPLSKWECGVSCIKAPNTFAESFTFIALTSVFAKKISPVIVLLCAVQ